MESSDEVLVEVHRLAVEGAETEIANALHRRVNSQWYATSRFVELNRLAVRTLQIAPQNTSALNDAGLCAQSLGDPEQALHYYNQALPIQQDIGDREGEAVTLSNIGTVHDNLGDGQQALHYYNQALPIHRDIGDRVGESVTLFNLAKIAEAAGNLPTAIATMEQVVAIDEQTQHPDLASDTTYLNQLRQNHQNSKQ